MCIRDSHVDLSKLSLEQALFELEETNHLIAEITGEEPEYVRPPFGAWKEELDTEITAIPVKWTVDPLDWTTENVQEIVEKVVTDTEAVSYTHLDVYKRQIFCNPVPGIGVIKMLLVICHCFGSFICL